MSKNTVIEVDNVSYHYPGTQNNALNNISLSFDSGQCCGLIGPNGAGKSTLLSALSGLISPVSGDIRFFQSSHQNHKNFIREQVALVPQEYAFYPQLSVLQNLNYFVSLCGFSRALQQQRVQTVLQQCHLDEVIQKKSKALSGGYKRRLNLAIALLKDPLILYLDEPTVGVDPVSRHAIIELIRTLKAEGKTLIYTSHMLDEVQSICDKIVMLKLGEAIQLGQVSEQLTLSVQFAAPVAQETLQVLRQTFGFQAITDHHLHFKPESNQALFRSFALLEQWGIEVGEIHYQTNTLTQHYLSLMEQDDPAKH